MSQTTRQLPRDPRDPQDQPPPPFLRKARHRLQLRPRLIRLENAFHTWTNDRLEQFRAKAQTRYADKLTSLDQEGKDRTARNELAMFAHPAIRFGAFLGSLLVFVAILRFTAPPTDAKVFLAGKDVIYHPEAEVCFGNGCLDKADGIHKVSLPFFDNFKMSGFMDHDMYYRFRLNVPEATLQRGVNTFFLPLVWGDADIFRSGTLIASGPNIQPIIPLTRNQEDVIIHVKKPAGQKFGIRGNFSPILTNHSVARTLMNTLAGAIFQIQYSFVAQLSGLCLLTILFLTFPYRPELFTFLLLFAVETLRAHMILIRDQGQTIFSSTADKLAYNALLIAGVFALILFVTTFFRRPIRIVFRFISKHSIQIAASLSTAYLLLMSFFPSISGENALFIGLWAGACILSLILVKDTLIYLCSPRSKTRFFMSSLTLASVAYWASMNIRQHLILTTAITSEYNNHLHFFFLMATILGIEIGRTEVKIKEAFSLLPKEVVRLIHEKKTSWRQGFVVVVDVVDWTSKLKQMDEQDTPKYIKKINEYLLSFFDEPGASVVSGTGDGFFLTFEGLPTEGNFLKLVSACNHLAVDRPTLQSLGIDASELKMEPVVVRSAIGYGNYYIGFVKTKHLKKDFLAGFLATALSRVIGNEKTPSGVRVLQGPDTDHFRGKNPLLIQETKGERSHYWQLQL